MKRFKGRIEHNKDSIHLLYKTAYETFEKRRIIIRMAAGFALALAGLFIELPMVLQGILLMAGAWLMVSRDFPARTRAQDVLEKRGQQLPILTTEFHDRFMDLQSGSSKKLYYKDVMHLVEAQNMIFLFFSRDSAVIIQKDTLEGGTMEEFIDFLEKTTQREFVKSQSWLSMSVRDLYHLLKKP